MFKDRKVRTLAGMTKLEHRIWERVEIVNDADSCWVWTGTIDANGYPVMGTKMYWDEALRQFLPVLDSTQGDGGVSKTVNVRRLLMYMRDGVMPDKASATCQTPGCVRLKHLVDVYR